MPYSMEFRLAVANAYEACGSSTQVAEELGCSPAWVRRLMQRERETGSLAPKPSYQHNTSKLNEDDLEKLRQIITSNPDMTLAELAQAMDNKISPPTVMRYRRKLGFTRKKSRSTPPSKNAAT